MRKDNKILLGDKLREAAENGDTQAVQDYIELGTALDSQDDHNNTALILAAQAGHTRIIKLLIDAGAPLDIQNQYGNTALILAASEGHIEAVKLLVNAGALLDIQGEDGDTALISTTYYDCSEARIVKILLDAEADVFLKNIDGKTALDIAKEDNCVDIIKILEDYIRHTLPLQKEQRSQNCTPVIFF